MTPKEAIVRACPELMELTDGCRFKRRSDYSDSIHECTGRKGDFVYSRVNGCTTGNKLHINLVGEIIGHPIQLHHVLRAIEAVGDEHLYADPLMRLLNVRCGGAAHFTGASSEELWDLAKTYEDQSAECKAFLEGILCK